MEPSFALAALASLSGMILLVSLWQHRLDREDRDKARAELKAAREKGATRALAQHPQIQATLCLGCGSCVKACPEAKVLAVVDGVSHVVNGAKCIGHAKCETACPVGALTVSLGDVSARPDIPLLSEDLETSVPGIYICGELGGIALIRNAVRNGVRALDAIARRLHKEGGVRKPGVCDVLIVGAGPAGLAASLRAIERKLSFVTISQDDLGGTIRKYPRRKLTLVQTVDIPLHGRLNEGVYEKEQVLDIWEKVVAKHQIPIQVGTTLLGAAREGGHFDVKTSAGMVCARTILLAMGRRGTPRRLGVPGEEQKKVLYQLVDAQTYTGQHLLVVGGGDSAIEAATALADQTGNTVTISYRKEAFSRLKTRNETRIKAYGSDGRVRVLFNSEVERIEAGAVLLRTDSGAALAKLPNDFVFIFAGGDLPYPLLKQMGIRFGGEDASGAAAAAMPAKAREPSWPARVFLGLGLASAAALAVLLWPARGYYLLDMAQRPLHPWHQLLAPGARGGLALAALGSILIFLNLGYLLRRSFVRQEWPGSLRSWMSFHVFTGLVGPLLILLHSGFLLRSAPAAIAMLAMLVVVVTGLIGRYIYSRTPRSVQGRELELDELRRSLAAYRDELKRLGIPMDSFETPRTHSQDAPAESVLEGILALVRGEHEEAREYRAFRDAVFLSPQLRPSAEEILALGWKFFRERQWLARYHELRSLMGSWRFAHRWFAILMLIIAATHILIAWNLGGIRTP